MKNVGRRFLTGLLYILPVVFFVICYFLITATEEDIAQGAGTTPDVWNDLLGAFRHNGRIADMYAWVVINFFDYQYSFGVDTIFRLIDLLAVMAMLVLLTEIVLKRRLRWEIKDAVIFGGVFLTLFLVPFGYTFYRGFSMVHNYLIIILALLGFAWPFLQKMRGEEITKIYQKWWFGIIIGLIFGMSANFPPLAFLATYVVVKVAQWWKLYRTKQGFQQLKLERWECLMIGGMLVSMIVGYVFGPGVSGYTQSPIYVEVCDYLPLGEIFQNFGGSMVRIFKHLVMNFGRTFGPALVIFMIGYVLAWLRKKLVRGEMRFLPEDKKERRMLLGILIFCVFCTLAGTQIIMPVRLCLPAYVGLVIVIWILFKGWWKDLTLKETMVVASVMVLLMVMVIGARGFFAWDFHERVGGTLQMIKDAEEDEVCIDLEQSVQRWHTPFNIFQQEETFVARRTTVQELYGKSVVYCNKK